jgi:hypothetical protein
LLRNIIAIPESHTKRLRQVIKKKRLVEDFVFWKKIIKPMIKIATAIIAGERAKKLKM